MHFIITFGFSIPIKCDGSTATDKVKRKDASTKKKIKKNATKITESPKNIMHVGQVLAEAHVEYELLPNYNFKFDCRCWETAAKIYTANDDWCLRPITCPNVLNTCWVLFSVHHVVHLNEIQTRNLFKHVTVCHISFGKQQFSERAKRDKVKGFYISDEDINKEHTEFLQIYPLDLDQTNSITKFPTPFLPQSTIITDDVYGDFSITTYLDVIPDRIHERKFRKMLEKERFPSESLKCQLFSFPNETVEKTTKKKTKTSREKGRVKKGKRGKGIRVVEVHLPAETFFSDMGTTTTYNRIPESNISSILIFSQCQNILSNKQLQMNMNPISIKLEQLSNLPIHIISESGFQYIYAKIFFVNHTIVTPCYTPNIVMCFEFVKCFLYEEFQPEELVNFLATRFLLVEVIGIKRSTEQSNHEASVIIESSTWQQVSSNEEVLLGIAEFDVSNLLKGFWEVKLATSLIHPQNMYYDNTNNINGKRVPISSENSPLTADILMTFCTSVKIKVRLAYDLQILQRKILRREDILNRIFLNLGDLKLGNDILKDVSSHNSNLMGTHRLSDENMNAQGKSYSHTFYLLPLMQAQNMLNHILTGFAIESSQRIYIFLEGLSDGYLSKIWKDVSKLPISHKCIYYNSNYVFLTRLYEDFMPLGGIIYIKVSEPLERKLREYNLYIGKAKRSLQAITIRKIGLINLTLTMKSLCQKQLFPEPNEVKLFVNDIRKIHIQDTSQFSDT